QSLPGFVSGHNLAFDTSCSAGTLAGCTSGRMLSDTGNIYADPKFINPTGDFHLQAGSSARGAGTSLTTVAGGDSGSGASLMVNDAGFFQNGYGIPGVQPDWIRVGPTTVAKIVSVNYNTNTLTLASAISRSPGDPVYLYKDSTGTQVLFGGNPDIGAYPFAATPSPSAPWSGILDPSRAIDWSQAGVIQADGTLGIPNRTAQCGSTIAAYNGTADAINTAITNCQSGQFVRLGAGTFNLSTGIDFGATNN